jgi:23S rRNA (cytidine1920-2'-O)/16S rRNA (cytidine1409-2'-O)-methyltransferase
MKQRLDILLVSRGLLPSRERAQMAIEQGQVTVNGSAADKPSQKLDEDVVVELKGTPLRYVSRGGLKLEKALTHFQLNFTDKRVLDAGASTGGFTDCALQHGAAKVYAVDVGTAQLDDSLRRHPSVVSYENTNFKDIDLSLLDNEAVDCIVADLSFVSIKLFFPMFKKWLSPDGFIIVLIKPQFELSEKQRLKKGILKNNTQRAQIVNDVVKAAEGSGFQLIGSVPTDADGQQKNIEYLAYFRLLGTMR